MKLLNYLILILLISVININSALAESESSYRGPHLKLNRSVSNSDVAPQKEKMGDGSYRLEKTDQSSAPSRSIASDTEIEYDDEGNKKKKEDDRPSRDPAGQHYWRYKEMIQY